jgi:DNA-directed RNA polymerase specialized sigma24 family protein
LDSELPSCFDDTHWTVGRQKLRDVLSKRVRSRFRWASAERSDVVQNVLQAAVRHRLLLRTLTPRQRSGWFWVVIGRMTGREIRRSTRAASLLAHRDHPDFRTIKDPRADDAAASIAQAEKVDLVRRTIETLPAPWREALNARNLHPDDWAAVARELGMTQPGARGLWYRAMVGLRTRLRAVETTQD